jgi:DNA-binding response OmpR family regulator
VDDEPDLREILQYNLEAAGYETDLAASAEEALEKLTAEHSLLLLDVMMGGMSGFALAEHLRDELNNSTPIIFLTAKDREEDLLAGFSAGADDYISKPFSLQEVLARVKAVLKRTAKQAQASELRLGNLSVNVQKKEVRIGGEEIRLSPKEYGILALLASEPGRSFSREEILADVWRGESCVLDRTVDVHIARIRRKLEHSLLRLANRQGYGYCLEECTTPNA